MSVFMVVRSSESALMKCGCSRTWDRERPQQRAAVGDWGLPLPDACPDCLTGTCWICEVTVVVPGAAVGLAVAVNSCWGAAFWTWVCKETGGTPGREASGRPGSGCGVLPGGVPAEIKAGAAGTGRPDPLSTHPSGPYHPMTRDESSPSWLQFPVGTTPACGSDVGVLAFQPRICPWKGGTEGATAAEWETSLHPTMTRTYKYC